MDAVDVELSKINFLLEILFAVVLRNDGIDPDGVAALADEVRRQATELPQTTYGQEPTEQQRLQHTELLAQRLDMFFSGVRYRVQSFGKE